MIGFVRARHLVPLSDPTPSTRIEDGYVLWRDGEILEAGAFDPAVGARVLRAHSGALTVLGSEGPIDGVERLEQIERLEGVLLPGFVKAHGHDHEPPIIGLVKDVPLTEWLDGVVNVFTKFMAEERQALERLLGCAPQRVAYLKARVDDLYYGITSSMVHHCNYAKYTVAELADANEAAGTRMIIAVGSQDRHYYEKLLDIPAQVAIERLDRAEEAQAARPRVTVVPGPDQLFSNGPELLKALKAWSRERGTLFHCHSSEEPNTTRWFCETYGQTPVEYAHELGILDDQTVLAHQVNCTDRDLDILASTGTKVVHNPLANTILGSGMPPIVEMQARGIPVCISTDGSGSSDNQNILAAARLASQYQKAVRADARVLPAQRVLEMITREPSRMLGLNAGSLEPGRAADIVLVATDRPNMTPTRRSNVIENLIWATDGSEVELVVAGGRLLRQGRSYHSLPVDEINAQVTLLAEAFDAYRERSKAELKGTGAHR